MRRVGQGGGHVIGYAHAVLLCDGADMVGGSDSACDGSLLLVIGKAFAGEEGSAALGDLDDDGGHVGPRAQRGRGTKERGRARQRGVVVRRRHIPSEVCRHAHLQSQRARPPNRC